jgi:hypothetical protein
MQKDTRERAVKASIAVTVLLLMGLVLMPSPVASQITNEPPFADAGKDMTVAVAEEVQFHGEGFDDDGRIDLFEWDFDGDGSYDWSNTNHGEATWTYQATGIYNAILRVTDNDADTDTDKAVITVVEGNEPPQADGGEDMKVHAEELVEFHGTGSDPDGDIIKYEWDFDGDGSYDYNSDETGETTWIYTIPDTYYATFKVTDDGAVPGNDTATIKVVVYSANRPPVANAGLDVTVHAKQSYRFIGKGTDIDGRIMKYEWDFDNDGKFDSESTSTGEAIWTYDKADVYTAVLKVTDNHELPSTDTSSITVTVLAPNKAPTADAGADVDAKVGDLVSFAGEGDDNDGDIVEYRWDFDGDGEFDWSSSMDASTYFIYQQPGTYKAKLEVEDDVGAIAQSNRTVTITKVEVQDDDPPLIQFNFNFIIALLIGLGIGVGIGVGATYARISTSIAKKYRKAQQLESQGGPRAGSVDEEPSFRGGGGQPPGGAEPPAFRGGDGF